MPQCKGVQCTAVQCIPLIRNALAYPFILTGAGFECKWSWAALYVRDFGTETLRMLAAGCKREAVSGQQAHLCGGAGCADAAATCRCKALACCAWWQGGGLQRPAACGAARRAQHKSNCMHSCPACISPTAAGQDRRFCDQQDPARGAAGQVSSCNWGALSGNSCGAEASLGAPPLSGSRHAPALMISIPSCSRSARILTLAAAPSLQGVQ